MFIDNPSLFKDWEVHVMFDTKIEINAGIGDPPIRSAIVGDVFEPKRVHMGTRNIVECLPKNVADAQIVEDYESHGWLANIPLGKVKFVGPAPTPHP